MESPFDPARSVRGFLALTLFAFAKIELNCFLGVGEQSDRENTGFERPRHGVLSSQDEVEDEGVQNRRDTLPKIGLRAFPESLGVCARRAILRCKNRGLRHFGNAS